MNKKDWYSPGSIEASYSKPMIKWLTPRLSLLRVGVFPRNPKETGYTDPALSKGPLKASANFETAVRIAAELDSRIEAAGADGMMLEFLYAFEPDDEIFVIDHIAQCLKLNRLEVSQRIRNALYYISGADRKANNYDRYVRDNHRYLRLRFQI